MKRLLSSSFLAVLLSGYVMPIMLPPTPANAQPFTVSDLVVFTRPNVDLTGQDAATFAFSNTCGAGGILLCFAVAEAGVNQPALRLPGTVRVAETAANPPGPGLATPGLAAVPVGTANVAVQLTEASDANALSDVLTMTVPANRQATFNFWSDAATEPTVRPGPGASTAEVEGKLMDVTATLFPGVAAANLPYKVFVLSDCGSDGVVCVADIVDVIEPSTLLLLGSGLAGLAGFAWKRQRK